MFGRQNMKKRIIIAVVLFNLIFFLISIHSYATDLTLNNTSTEVYFNPNGGCTDAIEREIGKAKNEVLVQASSFTSAPIARALTNAHKQGIKVEAILDKSQRSERYTSATYLKNAGIPVYIDSVHAIAHSKIMILDRETVITGSFNFTRAAEKLQARGCKLSSGETE
jgi:phosphatidylserine/phosphatidylglycerophosphate/cardiolipin synthase-like enzyme